MIVVYVIIAYTIVIIIFLKNLRYYECLEWF